jgi:hypothetical protein
MVTLSCDPLLLSGKLTPCVTDDNLPFNLRCLNGDYSLHAPICLDILVYEVP